MSVRRWAKRHASPLKAAERLIKGGLQFKPNWLNGMRKHPPPERAFRPGGWRRRGGWLPLLPRDSSVDVQAIIRKNRETHSTDWVHDDDGTGHVKDSWPRVRSINGQLAQLQHKLMTSGLNEAAAYRMARYKMRDEYLKRERYLNLKHRIQLGLKPQDRRPLDQVYHDMLTDMIQHEKQLLAANPVSTLEHTRFSLEVRREKYANLCNRREAMASMQVAKQKFEDMKASFEERQRIEGQEKISTARRQARTGFDMREDFSNSEKLDEVEESSMAKSALSASELAEEEAKMLAVVRDTMRSMWDQTQQDTEVWGWANLRAIDNMSDAEFHAALDPEKGHLWGQHIPEAQLQRDEADHARQVAAETASRHDSGTRVLFQLSGEDENAGTVVGFDDRHKAYIIQLEDGETTTVPSIQVMGVDRNEVELRMTHQLDAHAQAIDRQFARELAEASRDLRARAVDNQGTISFDHHEKPTYHASS